MKLLKLVGREEEKKLSFETAEKEAQESAAKRSQVARLLRQQSRIQSLLKQANTYVGIRNLVNGINVLQAAVHQFREVYPNGASPELPNFIAAHNDIVQCIEWVQRLADDDNNYGTPKLELKKTWLSDSYWRHSSKSDPWLWEPILVVLHSPTNLPVERHV